MLEKVHLETSVAVDESMMPQLHLHQWLCMKSCWSTSKCVAMDKPMAEQVHPWRDCIHDHVGAGLILKRLWLWVRPHWRSYISEGIVAHG